MSPFLLELEIDAACWEYLAQRIYAHGGGRPQPIVALLDAPVETLDDDAWNAAMRQAVALSPEPGRETVQEMTERILARMEE